MEERRDIEKLGLHLGQCVLHYRRGESEDRRGVWNRILNESGISRDLDEKMGK